MISTRVLKFWQSCIMVELQNFAFFTCRMGDFYCRVDTVSKSFSVYLWTILLLEMYSIFSRLARSRYPAYGLFRLVNLVNC